MSEFNEKNDKKVLKVNSMYGLAYFILSIWVICACIAVIVFGAVKKDLAFLYVVVAIGFAYCGTILICEIIRNLKEKATAITKKVICDYLSAKYSFVESNHRTDYTKPANGQTKGLLLPDTHYVVAHGEKVCFLYVYENDKQEVHILLKANAKQFKKIEKAPQNMMWVWYKGELYVLISIRPEWLCKIMNGEKTIEVRKKILKGM